MKRAAAWAILLLGMAYFILPLLGMVEFSLSMKRGIYSLEAYRVVLADPRFRETFSFSVGMALLTIAVGMAIVVPTAF